MFAMLAGAAWDGADPAAALAAQVDAGLDVVCDGRETVPGDGAAGLAEDLTSGRGIGSVERWTETRTTLRAVVAPRGASGPGATDPGPAVAAAIPGPYSLARRADRGRAGAGVPDAALVGVLAAALGREVAALAAAGCPLVRVDEPEAVDAVRDPGRLAVFQAAHATLAGAHAASLRTGVGETGARPVPGRTPARDRAGVPAIHRMLALTGGDHDGVGADDLAGLGYASFLFDLIAGPGDWRLIATLPAERGVVCGVVDAASPDGDAPEVLVWAAHYAASTRGRGLARVGLATTGSLAAVGERVATAKMRALGDGARIAALPADEIRARLDPRAIDMRSAALGAWAPDPRLPRRPRV
jgi:hypothetical protein